MTAAFVAPLVLLLAEEPSGATVLFRERVAPVLERRCLNCHNDAERKGGLSLQSIEQVLRGGESGAVLTPGQPDRSSLLAAVTGDVPDMPKTGPRLTSDEVAAVRAWIAAGAPWPEKLTLTERPQADLDWWSLRPLPKSRGVSPRSPTTQAGKVSHSSFVRNPIDDFIAARLVKGGLAPSPEADRRTLIRRLSFDLCGLPPTPDEVESFLHDLRPDAYEQLVERLLASPHYGERWARHWLDVVHYGDTHGYDKDKPRPHAWPYRDYVIRAFNEDKPYREFVSEQLAGDVVAPGTPDGIAALGFIAAGPWDFISHVEVPESKIDGQIARSLDRDDMVVNALNAFCSLTVQCARCHAHKFDPVSQTDYYRLQAVFAALDRADTPFDGDLAVGARRQALRARELDLLAQQHDRSRSGAVSAELERELQHLRRHAAELPAPSLVYAGTVHSGTGNFTGTGASGGKPRPIYVLSRGDVRQPGELVRPGAPPFVPGLPAEFALGEHHRESDRRAALAEWIAHRDNPLTWRSMANRLWQYHVGRGLVDSPNDFGRMGQQPTHPELLDWLAVELRETQSLKHVHRLIVTSAAYRQVSFDRADCAVKDSGNTLLWRANRRKLDAEAVRDSLLFVAGRLDDRMGGPGFQDFVVERPEHSPHYEYHLHDPRDPRAHRRSVYRFLVRSQPQPFMTALDCADPSMSVDKRNETINALQALALLNNGLTVVMADEFTRGLAGQGTLADQIDAAFQRALSRPPTDEERAVLLDYTERHGLANACRLLFNLNEFAFVD